MRFAIVDAGSFVLPYDYFLIRAVTALGVKVDFYCSETVANFHFAKALAEDVNCRIYVYKTSSTVASRAQGIVSYLRMLLEVRRRAGEYYALAFQYSRVPLIELVLLRGVRKKLYYFVHEGAGIAGARKPSFALKHLWRRAAGLAFVSETVRNRLFTTEGLSAKRSALVPHGPLGLTATHTGDHAYKAPERTLVFWGLVRPYKGIDLFGDIVCDSRAAAVRVEVHGKWAAELKELRTSLANKGVLVNDQYLEPAAVLNLLSRGVLFVLPYVKSSQSGVLYTLLNYACPFVATDEGDIGHFLKSHGLNRLLFSRSDVETFWSAVEFAFSNYTEIRERLVNIKGQHSWERSAVSLLELCGNPTIANPLFR